MFSQFLMLIPWSFVNVHLNMTPSMLVIFRSTLVDLILIIVVHNILEPPVQIQRKKREFKKPHKELNKLKIKKIHSNLKCITKMC